MEAVHYSVLKSEVLSYLKPTRAGELFIDCTTGEGGHSEALLSAYPDIKLICLDADNNILKVAQERLAPFKGRVQFCNTWFNRFFADYPTSSQRPDKILFDLGISTYHYEKSGRGFSFRKDEPLSMELGADLVVSAADMVNNYPAERLADIIYNYGEERYSRRIAKAIVEERENGAITTAAQLADVVWHAVPEGYRHGKIHPATRTFQALRIAVNGELERLPEALNKALEVLVPGGRMAVITFHSLEDRIVKNFFRDKEKDCICPDSAPRCTCGRNHRMVNIITKKPVVPSDAEIAENAASRSSKLRVAEKVAV